MVLGQTSYFVAARAASRRVAGRPDTSTEGALDANGEESPIDAVSAGADTEPETAVESSRRARYMAAARNRVESQIHERGMLTVYLTSALPTPVTTLATTAAATAGMSYWRFLVASFGGFLTLAVVLVLIGLGLLAAIRSFVRPGWFSVDPRLLHIWA
jgi:hypothetical protein